MCGRGRAGNLRVEEGKEGRVHTYGWRDGQTDTMGSLVNAPVPREATAFRYIAKGVKLERMPCPLRAPSEVGRGWDPETLASGCLELEQVTLYQLAFLTCKLRDGDFTSQRAPLVLMI